MHTDLSPQLHTEECNRIITALKACHDQYTFRKFIGICNSIDDQMLKCLKQERLRRRAANIQNSKEKHAAILKRIDDSTKNAS